jgi:hypothetical protein
LSLPGDFNDGDAVDAADYVIWRKKLGSTYTPNDYDVWRANFGRTYFTGSGAGTGATTIPEPATMVTMLFAAIGWCLRRRRVASKSQ